MEKAFSSLFLMNRDNAFSVRTQISFKIKSGVAISQAVFLLLLLFELLLDARFPARDKDAARKLRKVKVLMAPEDSQAGSASTSL